MSKNKMNHALLQYTAAFTASITAIGFVCGYSWPSPALPYLTGEKSEIQITKDQSAWIAAFYPLGLIIGYLLNPLFVDRIGRKRTLLMFSLPQVISWFLIIIAKNSLNLYVARIIGGIGYGGGISSSTVYISEIGNVKNRGIFLVLLKCMMNFGFLFTMILGAFLNYKNMNIVLLMMPVFFVLVFIFVPDSSYFQNVSQRTDQATMNEKIDFGDNDDDEAMVNLNLLNKRKENFEKNDKISNKIKTDDHEDKIDGFGVNNNVSEIKVTATKTIDEETCSNKRKIDDSSSISDEMTDNSVTEKNGKTANNIKMIDDHMERKIWKKLSIRENIFWKLYTTQNYRRALEILLVMGLTNILSGHAGITTFTQQIFTYDGAFLAPEKASVILALITLITSLLSALIVERVRRKILIAWTGVIFPCVCGYFLPLSRIKN
ncbi:uncharacterized protein LOC127280626 [Leptopilina boulardi]|uniref:uncharacterized protein LOC127280626 n=1 Tax=Leptopilina boulardi TaxID=63433 RepID=UPI0021F560B8|nr:uncharacterized protein LOC127280626 [Leptopilina boulardi]